MKIDTIYTERSDVVSCDEKLLTERCCTFLEEKYGWSRKLISSEKFKELFKHTTLQEKTFITHVYMRTTQYTNLFLNVDIHNKYRNSSTDLLIVLADKRKKFHLRFIWMSELYGISLKYRVGMTGGYTIDENLLHEFPSTESEIFAYQKEIKNPLDL
jgi:hypothetical protein